MFVKEQQIEQHLIGKLVELKYSDRPDIRDKAALEANFRAKFQALNKVQLTDAEFARLRDSIISADVFQAAKRLKERSDRTPDHPAEQLDFEFVLFSSALIDYDYIMALIARYSQGKPGRETMSRDQIVNLISAHSNLMDDRAEIIAYIDTLEAGQGHGGIEEIRGNYLVFRAQQTEDELAALAERHQIAPEALQGFVDGVLERLIFDAERLSELFAPLELGWKARGQAELALMADLVPVLKKQAGGREISGLAVYEH